MNNPPRILVVDDQPVLANDIQQQLVVLGYEPVGRATRGEQAIELAGQLRPDLVLIDVRLAGSVDAIAAAQTIRSRFSLPVVFLAAHAEEGILARATLTEPLDYIQRPCTDRELRAVVELALHKHAAEARKLESIGTLAGGIAHDFNNLLNAVLGQCALALAILPDDNPARSHVGKAITAAERAADLTRELLAYSGRGTFVAETVDLNCFLQDNALLLDLNLPPTVGLWLELDTSSLWIHGDIGQIRQAVTNIIVNAGESMVSNPGSVDIQTSRIALTEHDTEYWKHTGTPLAPGMYALLRVSDRGSGMGPEQLHRIFDPFFSTKFAGRGLGLPAVLGIVRSHKGGLRIASEEGAGTCFEVVLPLVDAPASTEALVPIDAPPLDGDGITVLVIDDDPSVLELVMDIFTTARFTVLGTPNPVEGIALYGQHRENISAVILDYSMPGMDGKTAFAELVKINSAVKVLVCSGYSEEDMASAFGEMRPAGFLHKPYRPTVLLEKTKELLAR